MLLNGGELEGVRILQRESVARMTRNQIGDLTIPFAGHGDGFGYGFGVLTDRGASADEASVGTYSWGGVFNTYYWVDPQEQMAAVLMTQIFPYDHLKIREEFKRLAYHAIDDSGFARVSWYEPGAEHANPHFNPRQLRVNAPQASRHPTFAVRSEPRSSGMARIRIDEDLRTIRRADLYSELWGGHPGTVRKRVSVNGRSLYEFPEVGSAEKHCTHQYHTFNLKPSDLVNGYNSLQFACDQGETFWGHYIVDNTALLIGLTRDDRNLKEAGLADFAVEVRAVPIASGEGYELQLAGDAQQISAISQVHYQARYYGFDENGNRSSTDWHGMTRDRQPYGMVGSSAKAPFQVSWDTTMLPAQQRVAVRAFVELKAPEGTIYTTPTLRGLEITKPAGERVSIHYAADLPAEFWSRAGREKGCSIDLALDPSDITAAESACRHVDRWGGKRGQVLHVERHAFPRCRRGRSSRC